MSCSGAQDRRPLPYVPGTASRPLSATDTTNNISYATGAHYSPPGALASLQYGGAINVTDLLNNRLQPCWMYATTSTALPWNSTACTGSATTGSVLDLKYNFSLGSGDNGNVMGITNNQDSTRSQSFAYDSLNRLLSAQTASTSGSNCWGESYGYDAWGNLLSISAQSGYSACTQENLSVSVDSTNRLSSGSGYYYDTAGNLTQVTGMLPATYSYDGLSELLTASTPQGSAAYIYDGDGQRVAKAPIGQPTQPYKLYWYGGGASPLDESDGSGNISAEYIFFGGKRIARRDSSGHVDYYFEDHLGTSRIVTDSSGNPLDDSDFYPFGGERPYLSSSGNTYKFTGKERDSESGLDNFGARFDSSAIGRFLTADWSATPQPVPYAKLDTPQSLNLYSYTQNSPVTNLDGDGHLCLFGIIGNTCSEPSPPPPPPPPPPPAVITPGTPQNTLANAQDAARNNPNFAPTGPPDNKTFCNLATCAVAKDAGAPLDALTNAHGQPNLANAAATQLATSPSWHEVTPEEAQTLANQGQVVVGVQENPAGHGHEVTVRPELMPGLAQSMGQAPIVNNIGAHVGVVPASQAFSSSQPVHYYAPNPQRQP
jgi:RHS repeat-associated protein